MTALLVSTPVPILQWEDEFAELLDVYRQRRPRRVLEIGTHQGGSLYHWLQNAGPGTTVVAVDLHHANAGLYAEWCPSTVEVIAIHGDSTLDDTAGRVRAHGPFDWIFIDAGHLEHEVRRDWELYGPMAAADAAIVFHDIRRDDAYPHIQVWPLWDELAEQHDHLVIGTDTGILFP